MIFVLGVAGGLVGVGCWLGLSVFTVENNVTSESEIWLQACSAAVVGAGVGVCLGVVL